MSGSSADKTKAITIKAAARTLVSPAAIAQQAKLAETVKAACLAQVQVDVAAAIASYSTVGSTGNKAVWAGGFVSPANYAAYDTAVKLAFSTRDSALALSLGLSE